MDTLTKVGAGDLAGLLEVAGDVHDIIGQLEGVAQVMAEPGQCLDRGRPLSAEQRAQATRGADQRRGLAVHHVQIVLHVRFVTAGPVLGRLQ